MMSSRIENNPHSPRPTSENPTSKEVLQKALFAMGPALPNVKPAWLSGHTMGSAFIVSDLTSLYRSTEDVLMAYLGAFPTSSMGWMKEAFSAKGEILDYHLFGTASGINAILGPVQMKEDFDRFAFNEKIGDKRALLMGRVSFVKGVALTGAGISFAAFRPLATVGTVKNIPPAGLSSPHLLGRVSYGFALAGMVFYGLFFALLSTIFGIKAYEGIKLKRKLNRAETLSEKVEILQKKVQVDREKLYEKLVKKHGSKKAARKELIKEAISSRKEGLRALMKDLNLEKVSEEKLEQMVYQIIESACKGENVAELQKEMFKTLETIGLEMKVSGAEIKNQNKVQRVLNQKGFEAIKELGSDRTLVDRVKQGDAEATKKAESLVDAIKKSTNRKLTENILVLAVLAMGAIAMVASIVFTAGIPLVASAVFMLLFTIAMTAVDGYYLLESYKGERPAKHDKKMLIVSSILGAGSLLSLVALGACGVVTMGTLPLVASLILAGLWFGQNGLTWYMLNRNDRLFEEKHPTLESFLEALQKDDARKKIQKMLENLPEEIKTMIESERANGHIDLKKATLEVVRKVEKAKKAHLEILRDGLSPYLVTA